MTTISLTLRDADNSVAGTVTGTFSEDDLVLTQKYVDAMTRVRNTELLKQGLPAITNMKWSPEGMEFSCEPYSDAQLFELLHVVRHVMLGQEPASFEKICALLGRRFADRNFGDHIKALRHLFENGELSSYMQISVGGQPLFDGSLLRMWLNGTQYHTDEQKAVAWGKLEGSLKSENARALVMNQLHSRVKALFLLEHIAQLVLSKRT
jgi:hypothetical protein